PGKACVRRNRADRSAGREIPPATFPCCLLKAPPPEPRVLVPASAPAHLPPANPAVRRAPCRVQGHPRLDKSSREEWRAGAGVERRNRRNFGQRSNRVAASRQIRSG